MLFAKNYQNKSAHVETTACQSWRIFETQCSSSGGGGGGGLVVVVVVVVDVVVE